MTTIPPSLPSPTPFSPAPAGSPTEERDVVPRDQVSLGLPPLPLPETAGISPAPSGVPAPSGIPATAGTAQTPPAPSGIPATAGTAQPPPAPSGIPATAGTAQHAATTRAPRTLASVLQGNDIPAEPVAVPQGLRAFDRPAAFGRHLRHAVCESLGDIRNKGERAIVRNLSFLRSCALASDPLVRKIARDTLQTWNPGLTRIETIQARWGQVEGPSGMLLRKAATLDCWDRPLPDFELRDAHAALDALDAAVGAGNPPEEAIQAVCWLLASVRSRASEPRRSSPTMLGLEPAKLQALEDRAGRMLDTWWETGRVKISEGSRTLVPGHETVRPSELASSRRARVDGATVDFGNPFRADVPASARQLGQDLLQSLSGRKSETSPELERLATLDPATATQVLEVVVESLDPSQPRPVDSLYRFNRIFTHVLATPSLGEAVRPLLGRIASYSTEAVARGALDPDSMVGRHQARIYEFLLEAHPELLTQDLLETRLLPFLHDTQHNIDEACRLFHELWTRRPDLVRPTLDGLLDASHNTRFLDERDSLIERAFATQDISPTRTDLDWIAAQIYSPYHPDEASFDGLTPYFELPDLLVDLASRSPHLIRGMELPNAMGHMVSLGRALVERIVFAPEPPLPPLPPQGRKPTPGEDIWLRSYGPISFPSMEPVYRFAFPDGDLEGDLLGMVERQAVMTPIIADWPSAEQRAAAVLMSAEIGPEYRERLREALGVERALSAIHPPLDSRSRALLHAFGAEVADQGCQRLERGKGSPEERSAALRLALHIADTPVGVRDTLDRDALRERALRAFDARLEGAGGSTEVYQLYQRMAERTEDDTQVGAEWARFSDLRQRLGPDVALERAYALHAWVEDHVGQGMDRERALTHALYCALHGLDPASAPLPEPSQTPPHVERGEDAVDIGGVKVPVRRNRNPQPPR